MFCRSLVPGLQSPRVLAPARLLPARRVLCGLLLAALPLAGGAPAGAQAPGQALRTLTGTVSDHQHEPLKGAIVQVEDEATGSITSYIADADGAFRFRRLSPGDDYKIWATYKGHRSKTHEMSHFDSKPDKVLPLVIRFD